MNTTVHRIEIVTTGIENLSLLKQIDADTNEFPWSHDHWLKCFQDSYRVFVMLVNDQPMAVAVLHLCAEDVDLLHISVQPCFQGQGYGKDFMRFLMEFSAEHATRMFLDVRVSNQTAIKLYQKCGFQQINIRKDYYQARGGREDSMTMRCDLGQL